MAEDDRPIFPSPVLPRTALGPAQRLIESATIALVTSTGLYLVGSVYTDAYYGRMSIDGAVLDLSPPSIASSIAAGITGDAGIAPTGAA